MSVWNLDSLFRPKSVAVIGASNQPLSMGQVAMRNLLSAGFFGPIMPVNPRYQAVAGVLTYPDIASLPTTPDLAVICTPPDQVPDCVAELGKRGTKAAVVLTGGLDKKNNRDGKTLAREMLEKAKQNRIRVLGPDCMGMIIPSSGLNASLAHTGTTAGSIAFVSQSDALCTAVLDWANAAGIGFSHFVSLGDSLDIDFSDVLDYLGADPHTRSVLLYIQSINNARRFMSAARSAARNKPVLVIKSGRAEEAARAAASHTGALIGSDYVYDAAFRRAGMLRVSNIDSLFDAVETLARSRPQKGDRLAVLTNGGGPGVLATDALIARNGRLAEISPETIALLDEIIGEPWSGQNPVDIPDEAPSEIYGDTLTALLKDKGVDAVLVMHVPTAFANSEDIAGTVVNAVMGTKSNVLTSWLGRADSEKARRMFALAGIPTYDTPEKAIRGFLHMVNYRRNQDMLMQLPPSLPTDFDPDTESAKALVRSVLEKGGRVLGEPQAKDLLAAYGVPVVRTEVAGNADDAVRLAGEIGYPVALKIISPDVVHKSDVSGVALDLETPDTVRLAADSMTARLEKLIPGARVDGFAVQRMAGGPHTHELIVGAATDPIFGPVILFGQGGTAVELIGDRAVAIPPLNLNLADDLISRTRISKLLAGYKGRPGVDMDAVRLTLIQVSQLIIDIPEIVELDINPLFAGPNGVLALDARVGVEPTEIRGPERLAIRPYPQELEECSILPGGEHVLLRPIRPEDEPAHYEFLSRVSPEDMRFRFFGVVSDFPRTEITRFTQIDYDREMAFIAQSMEEGKIPKTIGVVRAMTDPDNNRSEFAILIRSDMKGKGLGRMLMEKMIRYCKARGTNYLVGQAMLDNKAMVELARKLGFEVKRSVDNDTYEFSLKLND